MPGTRCAVAGCKNSLVVTRKRASEECVTYHSFPSDATLQKLWIKTCNREFSGKKIESLRVCSEHFTSDDYERDLRAELMNMKVRRILKKGAVPTLKLNGDQGPPQVRSSRVVRVRRPRCKGKTNKKKTLKANEPMQRFHVISAILDAEQGKLNTVSVEKEDLMRKNQLLETKLTRTQLELSKAMDMYRTRAAALGLTIRQLKQEVQLLKRQRAKPTLGLAIANDVLKTFLSENQVKMVLYGMKRVNWTPNEIFAASTLKNISKRAYIYLQKKMKYPLPGLSTLGRYSIGMKTADCSDSEESDVDDIGSDCEEYGAGLDHMREPPTTSVVEYEIEVSNGSSMDGSSRTPSSEMLSDVTPENPTPEKASCTLDRPPGSNFSVLPTTEATNPSTNLPFLASAENSSSSSSAVQSKTFSLDEPHSVAPRNAVQVDNPLTTESSLRNESPSMSQQQLTVPNVLSSRNTCTSHESIPARNVVPNESLQSISPISGDSLSATSETHMHGHPLCVPSQTQFPNEPLTAPSENPVSDTSLLDISRNVIPRAYAMDMPDRIPFSNTSYVSLPPRTEYSDSSGLVPPTCITNYSVANSVGMHEQSQTHFPDSGNISRRGPFTDASAMSEPHRIQYSTSCSVGVTPHGNQYPSAPHYGQIPDDSSFHENAGARTQLSGNYAFHMQQTLQ